MYARHVVLGEDRRAFEEGRFGFQDGLHAAEPLYPFDSFVFEYASITRAFRTQRSCRSRARSGLNTGLRPSWGTDRAR